MIAGANTTASSFDALGNLYLGGYIYDAPSVDLDPGPATANIRSGDGSVSMFVAKYTSVFSDVLIPPTLEATVLAFPNPSIDKIQLSITTTTQSILECEIFDAMGRSLIASSHLNCAEGENQFVFEELAPTEGTCFLRISDSAGRVKTVNVIRK